MKTERYIVEIEMPEGDYYSAGALKDDIKTSNYEEFVEGRWKFDVKPFIFPSEEEVESESRKFTYPPLFKAAINWLKSKVI